MKFMEEFEYVCEGMSYYYTKPTCKGWAACNPENIRDHLDKSRDLLQLVCEHRKAPLFANTVTGHILPPELVNMAFIPGYNPSMNHVLRHV